MTDPRAAQRIDLRDIELLGDAINEHLARTPWKDHRCDGACAVSIVEQYRQMQHPARQFPRPCEECGAITPFGRYSGHLTSCTIAFPFGLPPTESIPTQRMTTHNTLGPQAVYHDDHYDHCADCRSACGTSAEGMAHK